MAKIGEHKGTANPSRVEVARGQMTRVHVGSRVRIADGAILNAALRGPAERRPEPGQMTWAGRDASVIGYQRGAGNGSLYALKGAPGLWAEDWIDPI
jgi:hypothetical protein